MALVGMISFGLFKQAFWNEFAARARDAGEKKVTEVVTVADYRAGSVARTEHATVPAVAVPLPAEHQHMSAYVELQVLPQRVGGVFVFLDLIQAQRAAVVGSLDFLAVGEFLRESFKSLDRLVEGFLAGRVAGGSTGPWFLP